MFREGQIVRIKNISKVFAEDFPSYSSARVYYTSPEVGIFLEEKLKNLDKKIKFKILKVRKNVCRLSPIFSKYSAGVLTELEVYVDSYVEKRLLEYAYPFKLS